MDKYSGRPWLTPALRESLAVVDRWDDLQAARAGRNWAEVGRQGRWLASKPARAVALAKLWSFRWQVRRRARATPGDGRASMHPVDRRQRAREAVAKVGVAAHARTRRTEDKFQRSLFPPRLATFCIVERIKR